jgi:hypothetical protein
VSTSDRIPDQGSQGDPGQGAPKPRSRRFFYIRVGVLLAILVGVLLWAWRDVRSRRARNEWDHTLTVAILLVRLEPIDDVAITALRKQLPALEDRLSAELARYRPGAPRPFRFELKDPIDGTAPPPAPPGDGPIDLAKYAYALGSYVDDVDKRAGVDASLYDVRIYVALRRPRQAEVTLAEGRSEQGGRVGVVEVELDTDAEGAHLPLVVVAHELMHTLGATDKYDANGRTIVPLGLAEPDRVPVFPQRYAEIMARNRPLSATEEKVPDSFDQVAVGPVTAREIGWLTSSTTATYSSPPVPARPRRPSSDVTFLAISDTHFGFGGIEAAHDVLVPRLNHIAGREYPSYVGGVVALPRGLIVTGDLTEWGRVEEWQPFVATYGLTGKEGKVGVPVFEVIGNHDRVSGPWVEQQVSARHGGGRFYSWDWDGVHLIALGEAPDDEGLKFLESDLARVDRDAPLVVYFHLALLGPWSTGNWFAEGTFKDRLAKLLDGRNVAAIFHGHHHATDHYTWHGFDVFKPGAVKDGAHTFAVVHVTDERVTVASFDWDHDAWADYFDKALPLPKAR